MYKIKFWQIKLLLVITASILSLIFLELVTRIYKIYSPIIDITMPSSTFGFENIPNIKVRHQSSEFDVLIKTNSKGLRDREISYEKSPGKVRIAIVGDSFIVGNQVNLENTIPKRLENILNGTKYEVINFGVSGYGLDQKYLTIREKVTKYDTDIIILFLTPNDLDDIKRNDIVEIRDGQLKFKEIPVKISPLKKIRSFASKSNFLTFLYFNLKQKILQKEGLRIEHKLYLGLWDGEVEKYAKIAEELILNAKASASISDSKLIVVMGTDKLQTNSDDKNDFEKIYEKKLTNTNYFNNYFSIFAKRNNIMHIDLYPLFARSREELYFRKDGHWNERGQELAAVELAKYLYLNKAVNINESI